MINYFDEHGARFYYRGDSKQAPSFFPEPTLQFTA